MARGCLWRGWKKVSERERGCYDQGKKHQARGGVEAEREGRLQREWRCPRAALLCHLPWAKETGLDMSPSGLRGRLQELPPTHREWGGGAEPPPLGAGVFVRAMLGGMVGQAAFTVGCQGFCLNSLAFQPRKGTSQRHKIGDRQTDRQTCKQ